MPRKLDNWLKGYLLHTNEQMSPDIFHIWCGLSAIASVLRRHVYYDYGHYLLYPNLYVVLTSPAGRCKKSTSMRIARGLFTTIPDIAFSPDSASRARLIRMMSMAYKDNQSALTVHSSEFASLLGTSGMDMVVFLTDIYDSPPEWQHQTESGGTSQIKVPYLNLLAGTTPDWIAKAMPLDTIGIGLTSRVIFIYADEPRIRSPFPRLSPAQKELGTILFDDLSHIAANLKGEYHFDGWYDASDDNPDGSNAYATYSKWFRERPDKEGLDDPRLAGYFERKPDHVVKVCMALAASRRDDLLIEEGDLADALDLFSKAEKHMPKVFANTGKNPLAMDYEAVYNAVFHAPEGFSTSDLLNKFSYSISMTELNEVCMALATMKKIALRDGRWYAEPHSQNGS